MLKLLKHANTRPIILLQTCKHATNHLIANMHVQRYQRYQHANTRPMRPLQTCKHANMRRYQGSRRYQRYQRSRRRKRHANQQSRDHAHANTAVTPKIPKIAKTQHANWQTKLPPPTHAKACVITLYPDPSQRRYHTCTPARPHIAHSPLTPSHHQEDAADDVVHDDHLSRRL